MLPPLIQYHRRSGVHQRRERGVTLLLVAVAMMSIITMAGLSIDIGTLYQASAEAQRSADAAALAAARMVSVSGLTGDPTNGSTDGNWAAVCGGDSSPATMAAVVVAQQNIIGGAVLPSTSVSVTYVAGKNGGVGDKHCENLGAAFGVNPVVSVKVTQSGLPTYFSRIWGRSGNSVSATATAEAFNPSNSGSYSADSKIVPVQPRCVKPWVVPNYDPLNPQTPYCTTTTCNPLVNTTTVSTTTPDGSIGTPGIWASGSGVIGETFWLVADCVFKQTTCVFRSGTSPPQVNASNATHPHAKGPPNLHYLPGQTLFDSTAVPSDGSDACSGSTASNKYAEAIAGCDQSTKYECGVPQANYVDLNENPGAADTSNGAQCLTHGNTGQDALQMNGATSPPTPSYPFQILAGANNPLVSAKLASSNEVITSSTSIVSLPIYDSTATTTFTAGTTNKITIIGFLQVFINSVDNYGNVSVTVMNVAGCGNNASGAPLTGTSPVPVRLITPP